MTQIGAITQLDIGGSVDSKITFSNLDNLQNFLLEATGTNVSIYGFELESLEIKGETENLYGLLDYNLSSTAFTQKRVQTSSSTLDVQVSANQGSTEVSIIGELKLENELISFSVMESTLRQQSFVFPIRETAKITIQGGKFEIENASWQVGEGILQLSGDTANSLFVNLSDIPLDITKIFFPEQLLVGILNGELEINLYSDMPQIMWDLSISQSNEPLQEKLVNSITTEGSASIIQNQITAKTDVSLQSLDFIPILDEQNFAGKFEVEFEIAPIFAGNEFKIVVNAKTFGLRSGISEIDSLIDGEGLLKGEVVADFEKSLFEVSTLSMTTKGFKFQLAGDATIESVNIDIETEIPNINLANSSFFGAVNLSGSITGKSYSPLVDLEVVTDRLLIAGNTLDEVSVKIKADLIKNQGFLNASSKFRGQLFSFISDLAWDNQYNISLKNVNFGGSGIKLVGNSVISTNGLVNGALNLEIPDLSHLNNYLPFGIEGKLTSEIQLSIENNLQNIEIKTTGEKLDVLQSEISEFEIYLEIFDAWKKFELNANLSIPGVTLGGLKLDQINGVAKNQGRNISFSVDSYMGKNSLLINGIFENTEEFYKIVLDQADLNYESISIPLSEPARLSFQNGILDIEDARWDIMGGVIGISGDSNSKISAQINQIPVDIINKIVPDLGIQGSVSGSIESHSYINSPLINWQLEMSEISIPLFEENSFDPLNAISTGSYSGNEIKFDLQINNDQNVNVTTSGATDLTLTNLNADVIGNLPLKLLDGIPGFAARSINFDGILNINFEVDSSISPPKFNGFIAIENGTYSNPLIGLEITELSIAIKTENNFLIIEDVRGKIHDDGEILASGTVELDPEKYFPADIKVDIKKGRIIREQLISLTFDANNLTIQGPITTNPDLKGEISISSLEISIPDQLPGGYSDFEVQHVSASPEVTSQAKIFQDDFEQPELQNPPFDANLDVSILVSNGGFYIRGRGIFAEMGGDIKLIGTTQQPEAIGVFTMENGRLSLLGKNFIFERGVVTFSGNLIPELDFLSTYETSDATIYVRVNGQASDPEFIFESIPDLPQDEILALLIFGRPLAQLSTTQVATLAVQIAAYTSNIPIGWEFVGDSLGVDILDLSTDEEGNTNFEVGKYINEKIYFGLSKIGDTSSVAVDIDITKNLKGHGELDELGESKVGVEFNYDF